MRGAGFALVVAVCTLFLAGTASAAERTIRVVDDDRAQRAQAEFTSIQAAVNEADPGGVMRVCPGRYPESMTVDKPLTLRGNPDAVETVDCFDPGLGELDPSEQVIVDGSGSSTLALFTLASNDITLEGFVLQGAANPLPLPGDEYLFRRGVDVRGDYSGYRVHHNLIRRNTVGIDFGSNGVQTSRFDHNCVRQNRQLRRDLSGHPQRPRPTGELST